VKRRDLVDLLVLAALWGGSFLFMRVAAPDFGAVPLAAVRVTGAALFLLPLLLWRGEWAQLKRHWRPVFVVGLTNSGLPFLCFSFAALSITAGLASIFNATTPLWGALIAWLWLRDRLDGWRVAGLALGFAGVVGLAWEKASFKPGADGSSTGWAVLAVLAATLMYGFAANYTKKRLTGVPPMALAAGSQIASAVTLLPLGLVFWPQRMPGATAWGAAVALALLCTGIAYVLYFRLIGRVGPARAMAVTYLVPAFAMLWGALFLGERITPAMMVGGLVILAGTALATGLLRPAAKAAASQAGS
jgi:drug/metabolite transporter (DMT)-like permease